MSNKCAKFHQNWWCRFGEKRAQDTEGHSFIIIRIDEIGAFSRKNSYPAVQLHF